MKNKKRDQIDNIYFYDDYRVFLKDYFTFLQKQNRKFSFRSFSRKVGISQNLIGLVLKGDRNISPSMAELFSDNINLKKRKKKYFLALVQYNQAKKIEDAEKFFTDIKKIKKAAGAYTLDEKEYEYYDKWYYPVLKELITWYPWNNDCSILAKAVDPPITTSEAEKGLEILLKIGLIKVDSANNYTQSKDIISGDSAPVHKKLLMREKVMALGIEATRKFTKDERYTTFHSISLDNQQYEKAISIIQEAESKIQQLVNNKNNKDQKVYEVIFNTFPVTKDIKGKNKGKE